MNQHLTSNIKESSLILIVHNVRSAHNVGSLFRTADGAGVGTIYLTGYTPRPAKLGRLVLSSAEKELHKTALGAEETVSWQYQRSLPTLIKKLRQSQVRLIALEQSQKSIDYRDLEVRLPSERRIIKSSLALLVGNEVTGLLPRELALTDTSIDLPMRGEKESLNVSVAGGIALYELQATIEEAYANKKRSRQ